MFDVCLPSGTFDSKPDMHHHQIRFWCLPLTCLYTVVSKCQHNNISSNTSKSVYYIQLFCWTWQYWLTVSFKDMKNFVVIMTVMVVVVYTASLSHRDLLNLIREEANHVHKNMSTEEVRKLQNYMWLVCLFYNILTIQSCHSSWRNGWQWHLDKKINVGYVWNLSVVCQMIDVIPTFWNLKTQ